MLGHRTFAPLSWVAGEGDVGFQQGPHARQLGSGLGLGLTDHGLRSLTSSPAATGQGPRVAAFLLRELRPMRAEATRSPLPAWVGTEACLGAQWLCQRCPQRNLLLH